MSTTEPTTALRTALAGYVEEVDREHYLHFSGRKPTLGTAAIVDRWGRAATPEAVRAVIEAATATSDVGERRHLHALAQAAVGLFVERELASVTDELATAEARATVTVDGTTLGYHAAAVALQNEPDRDRRRRLEAARLDVVAGLDPLRRRRFQRHCELLESLGFDDPVALYARVEQIDLDALGQTMTGFLARTRDLYLEAVSPWYEEVVGVGFERAERHDAAVLFRMADRDAWFLPDRLLETLAATLAGLGVPLEDQPNVHLDTEDRPGKHPRAFCAPVRVPEEIYLVIRPTGGYQDYRALFHEAGHAEHFAHTDTGRPFEERHLGDNSVTEAWAFTLEHLLADQDFLVDRLGVNQGELSDFHRRAHTYLLYMLRRYAAKLLYELELYRVPAAEVTGMAERYAAILTTHLGFRHPPQSYLDDVDPGFYVAQYLRAWMLEAQMRRRWESLGGDHWWRSPAIGEELRHWWSLGQARYADELADLLEVGPLGPEAVEGRIRAALATL